jgi:hypothetical protein
LGCYRLAGVDQTCVLTQDASLVSSDVIVAGGLDFPKGGARKWVDARTSSPTGAWPKLIAPALDECDEDEASVAEALDDFAKLSATLFVDIDASKDRVVFRGMLNEDEYGMLAEGLVRVLHAAARLKASGRVVLVDDTGGWGGDIGAVIELADGRLRARGLKAGARLDPADEAALREARERATEAVARLAEKARSKKRT